MYPPHVVALDHDIYCHALSLLSLLGKGRTLHLYILKSFKYPLPKNALCHDRLKLAPWFWRRFLNFVISLLSPLGKEHGPSFKQTSFPFTQGCFVPSLVDIGSVVVEKKMKMLKVYRWTDRRTDRRMTDDRRSDKLTRAFSLGDLKKYKFWRRKCKFYRKKCKFILKSVKFTEKIEQIN